MLTQKISRPKGTRRRAAFSLVLSLTVMAMLLLLCIGAAALLTVELRVSRATASYAKARLNAMAGARIALGEIQRRLGPDQRISATADILCDPAVGSTPKDIDFYKSSPNNTAPGVTGTVVHPRWTGVWNSGRVADGTIATTPVEGDETKVIQRDAQNGYLQDARFANGNDWAKSRADHTKTKRFGGWLVSGNEATTLDFEKTPFTPIASTDELIVGPGILGKLFNMSEKLSDMMGVRVPSVTLPSATAEPVGRYAYWVSDEGVKARVNLTDPYEVAGKAPDGNGGAGYFRLMVPQRNNLTIVNEPADFQYQSDSSKIQNTPSGRWTNYAAKAKSGKWANCSSFADLTVVDAAVQDIGAAAEKTVAANYLHDLTFDSSSVLADVVNGGLRRDLTPFLEIGTIAKASGTPVLEALQPSELLDTTPILNDAGISIFDKSGPLLKYLRSWNDAAPTSFTGPTTPQTPPSFTYGGTPVPVPDYANQGAAGAVALSPVLAAVGHYYTVAYDPAGQPNKFKFLFFPRIVLWNPYDVPMDITGMEVMNCHDNYGANNGPYTSTLKNPSTGESITLRFATSSTNTPFRFNFPSMTLKPGESVCFRGGEPGKQLQAGSSLMLAVGDPSANMAACYAWAQPSQSGTLTPAQEADIENGQWTAQDSWYLEQYRDTGSYPKRPDHHVYLLKNGVMLQQIDSEHFTRANLGFWPLASPSHDLRVLSAELGRSPHRLNSRNFRLTWFDDYGSMNADPRNPASWSMYTQEKNTEMNGIVEWNLRATRFTRFPTDMLRQPMPTHRWSGGLFQYDNDPRSLNDPKLRVQGGSSYVSPLFSNDLGANGNKRYTIYPMPRRETGLLSLAALQGAPLIPFAWSSSMPVGNSILDCSVPTDRSAVGKADEKFFWTIPFGGWGMNFPVAQGILPSARVGTNLTLVDWSYELNNALWDGYFFSGIEKSNDGWGGKLWEKNYTSKEKRFRNTRLQQVRNADGDNLNNAIRASRSCLLQGGFNVNSTSVTAWAALLSAFRDIPVATETGQQPSTGLTPFLRNLYPSKGPLTATAGATFDDNAWAGYRALSDEEILRLADAIVKEVRTQGPFLSLADFVNHRLKKNPQDSYKVYPAASYGNDDNQVKLWELGYLGPIQAAIYNAGINDRFDTTDYFVNMKRTKKGFAVYGPGAPSPGASPGSYWTIPPRMEHLPRHKAAGAPGYLMQADVLQQIGSVLTARSDTFKIRCKGVSDDGAEAIVELIVQRTPDALVPFRDNGSRLQHVPESITTGPLVGCQHFGRRFVINSFRYVNENEI